MPLLELLQTRTFDEEMDRLRLECFPGYPGETTRDRFDQPRVSYRSVLISRCDLSHEVTPVTSGVRKTLVSFLAPHAGNYRRSLVRAVAEG